MYIDITSKEFIDESAIFMYYIFEEEIDDLFIREGGILSRGCYNDSSRKNRFSLYYISDSLVFDQKFIPMKILSFALSRLFVVV